MTTWTGDVAGGARSWVEAQVGAAYKGCWKLSAQEAKVRVTADKAAALLKCSGNDGVIVTPMERDSGRSVVWLPAPTSGSASAGYLKQAREDAQKHGGLVVVNSRGLGLSLPKDRAATVCLAVQGVLADDEHPLFAVDVDANVDADHLVAQIGGRFVTARNLGHGQRRVWFRVARDHRNSYFRPSRAARGCTRVQKPGPRARSARGPVFCTRVHPRAAREGRMSVCRPPGHFPRALGHFFDRNF